MLNFSFLDCIIYLGNSAHAADIICGIGACKRASEQPGGRASCAAAHLLRLLVAWCVRGTRDEHGGRWPAAGAVTVCESGSRRRQQAAGGCCDTCPAQPTFLRRGFTARSAAMPAGMNWAEPVASQRSGRPHLHVREEVSSFRMGGPSQHIRPFPMTLDYWQGIVLSAQN